jgi:uncharacterized membrane protein
MEIVFANVQVKIVDSYLYNFCETFYCGNRIRIYHFLKNISSLFPNSLLRAVNVCYSALNSHGNISNNEWVITEISVVKYVARKIIDHIYTRITIS